MASLPALAAPPIPFDGYTVNSGDITAVPCPAYSGVTITCGSLSDPTTVVSDGMLQRQITFSGAGPAIDGTYIQFIITEPGVTGDAAANPFTSARGNLLFTNEDFVKMHGRSAGISSKQAIIESDFVNPDLENRFVNITEYEYGPWANTSSIYPWVKVQQEITQVDYTNYNASIDPNPTVLFSSTADLNSNGNGFTDNFKIELAQMVDMTDTSGYGVQGFQYVNAKGQYQTSSNTTDPLLPGGTNGGSVTWNAGDEVSAMWIGQNLAGGAPSGASNFGFTKYTAVSTVGFIPSLMSSALTSFTSTDPVNWNLLSPSVFGLPPALPTGTTYATASAAVAAPDPIAPTLPAGSPPVGTTTPVTLPVNYYGWTVSNGVFTLDPCPLGVYCGTPIVNEGGLLQRIVSSGGVDYIQTIVTDPNATGDPNNGDFIANSLAFKSENFVRIGTMGGGGGGIGSGVASTLHIAEQDLAYVTQVPGTLPTTGGQFAYNTELKTGWANGGPLDPRIAVDQRILVPDTNFPDVSSTDYTFTLKQGQSDTDKMFAFSDVVGTVTGGNGFDNPIVFKSEMRSGAFQNNTRTLTDPALLPSTGGNIAWNAGEAIQVTWIGGEYVTPDPFGPSRVSTVSYTNLSTGDRTAATRRDVSPPNPETWVDPFTQPPPTYSTTYT
ncbi:MAG: hypothetical protein ACE5ET_07790, partial [Gammaproteobacteria bacterium]